MPIEKVFDTSNQQLNKSFIGGKSENVSYINGITDLSSIFCFSRSTSRVSMGNGDHKVNSGKNQLISLKTFLTNYLIKI